MQAGGLVFREREGDQKSDARTGWRAAPEGEDGAGWDKSNEGRRRKMRKRAEMRLSNFCLLLRSGVVF